MKLRYLAITVSCFAVFAVAAVWILVPAVQSKLQSQATEQLELAGLGQFTVTMSGRDARLEGETENPLLRQAAARVIGTVGGVRRVVNDIQVYRVETPTSGVNLSATNQCHSLLNGFSAEYSLRFERLTDDPFPDVPALVDRLADILGNCPDQAIQISGHTADLPGEQENIELSFKRADTIRRMLIERGINAERLSAFGYGATIRYAHRRGTGSSRDGQWIEFHVQH